jgi:hypothetical protein
VEKTYAVISNNKVINLISWDGESEYASPHLLIEVLPEVSVSIGDTYIDSIFSAGQE